MRSPPYALCFANAARARCITHDRFSLGTGSQHICCGRRTRRSRAEHAGLTQTAEPGLVPVAGQEVRCGAGRRAGAAGHGARAGPGRGRRLLPCGQRRHQPAGAPLPAWNEEDLAPRSTTYYELGIPRAEKEKGKTPPRKEAGAVFKWSLCSMVRSGWPGLPEGLQQLQRGP